VFPGKDVTFGSVVDNAAHLRSQIPKNLRCWGVNRHLQAKVADHRWMTVCGLQVDRFLPTAGDVLFADGSVMLGTHYP